MSRDLSHAYCYLRIAEVYREARQLDHALLWAEKGLKAFPEPADARLREFVAEEYHRRGRHEDAMTLIWAAFSERPYIESYRTLERHAKEAGSWPEWRERALAEIRRRIATAKEESRRKPNYGRMRPTDHSQLVEIYVHEQDVQAAWQEAQAGGCSDGLWIQLAAEREIDHPADAVPIYLKQAEAAVITSHYANAVELLAKAAALMKRLGRSAEFVRNLEALRTKYKIKRNFTKRLEQNRSLLYLS
jgi:uncharacterized Zn finger protein